MLFFVQGVNINSHLGVKLPKEASLNGVREEGRWWWCWGGRGEGQRRKLALVDEVQTEFIPLMFALSNNRCTTESVFSFDLKSGS